MATFLPDWLHFCPIGYSRLLNDKSIFQYGTFCTRAVAEKACKDAQALIAALDARNL